MFDLRTARLHLRRFTPHDLPALSAITRDADVMRYIGRTGAPWSDVQTARALARFDTLWEERRLPVWAVAAGHGAGVLGWCGFFPLDGGEEVELAYLLGRPAWGQGYATEAARGVLGWAFASGGFARVAAFTYPANLASQRVLEKLAFVPVGPRVVYGRTMRAYTLARAGGEPLGVSGGEPGPGAHDALPM